MEDLSKLTELIGKYPEEALILVLKHIPKERVIELLTLAEKHCKQ